MSIKKALVLNRRLTVAEADDLSNKDWGAPKPITIAGGVITLEPGDWWIVETEAGAALDDLTRINGLGLGGTAHLYLADPAHKIIVRHGTFLKLSNAQDFLMDTAFDSIQLRGFGGDVSVEYGRVSSS